jgi:heterodisulfide reductase subunit C
MTVERNIKLEANMDHKLYDYIRSLPGGEKIKDCIQCGNCSGSCPTSYMMDYSPRQIFAMLRAGLRKEILESDAIWMCCSCYSCLVRCPKGIAITDILYALKNMSLAEKGIKEPDRRFTSFASSFVKQVNSKGKNHETKIIIAYFLKTNPFALIKNTRLGLSLFLHGRLPILGKKIKNLAGFRKMIKKVNQISEAKRG